MRGLAPLNEFMKTENLILLAGVGVIFWLVVKKKTTAPVTPAPTVNVTVPTATTPAATATTPAVNLSAVTQQLQALLAAISNGQSPATPAATTATP